MGEPDQNPDVPPVGRLCLMENHHQAYGFWRDRDARHKVLVHLDAHHDMWWTSDAQLISIANFLCPALKDDVIREIYWIVPDRTWETAKSRKAVARHLQAVQKTYPGPRDAIRRQAEEISTTVMGKPLRVRPLAALPALSEAVLLDIDIDFLVIPRVTYRESDPQGVLPWCWPQELVGRLRVSRIQPDFITIAYSVEGGFTPLKWKYLGDELALRLRRLSEESGPAAEDSPHLRGMALMREAAIAADRRDFAGAEQAYSEAAKLIPKSAAPCYHLAHLYLETGRTSDARASFEQALELDPTYRTPYNSPGLKHHSERRFGEARADYLRTLALNPADAYAHFGLGRLAARQRLWSEAESHLSKSIALDHQFTDAYRVLGNVLEKQCRREDAIVAYERSLKLALAGHKPLGEPIATFVDESDRTLDPEHGRTHARVARLYALKGATTEAINGYRISIAGQYDGFVVRSRLARLYAKQKQLGKAAREAVQAVRLIPKSLGRALRRCTRHLRLDAKAVLARLRRNPRLE
jgi:tetratricopeptide (TPR) repeat protein